MAVENKTNTYITRKEILQFPDDYVASPQFFDEQSKLAVKENGKSIIKAGTPFPANDATAVGIVFNDYDVTHGDQNGAILVRGHINLARCEANYGKTISAAAKTALKGINFYPLTATVIAEQSVITYSNGACAVGATSAKFVIGVEGTDFKSDKVCSTLSNYTFAAGTTALALASAKKIGEKQVEITVTSAAAVAGTFTIQAKASALVNATASNVLSYTVA